MSMDKKLTSAVYAAVEKAYDHRCDIEDAADEILEIIEADRKRRGEPVAWIQRSYLNLIRESNVALHNVVVRGSILDGDGDVVPLFTAPQHAEPIVSDVEAIVRLLESREWAEHVATTPLGQRLETAVTVLV